MKQKDLKEGRSITLNDLLDEQHALNMRMLLAVQLRDPEAQAELKAELEGTLTILRSQVEGQKAEEIARLTEESREQIEAINASYEQSLEQFAQEIVGRITEG